jgi:hypothetical protein
MYGNEGPQAMPTRFFSDKVMLERKTERVRKDNRRVEVKRKYLGESEIRITSGRKEEHLIRSTQAMPARPSDNVNNT